MKNIFLGVLILVRFIVSSRQVHSDLALIMLGFEMTGFDFWDWRVSLRIQDINR